MNDPQIGRRTVVRRTFSQRDFDRFAALSGDDNPIHVDAQFAAQSAFGRTVAHGMFLYGVVCGALNHFLPGARQIEQALMFPHPTFAEEVEVQLEITASQPHEAELSTMVVRAGGEVGLQGSARLRLPGAPPLVPPSPPAPGVPLPAPAAFKGLTVGQQASTRRAFTVADLQEYAGLTGDSNPQVTVPGGLLGGMFSFLLGTCLPGCGTNYLKQHLLFGPPAHAGEELTATVEIVRLRPDKELVNLRTVCANPAGQPVCVGEALVLVRDVNRNSGVTSG